MAAPLRGLHFRPRCAAAGSGRGGAGGEGALARGAGRGGGSGGAGDAGARAELARRGLVAVGGQRRELRDLPHGLQRLLPRLQGARRRLPAGVGPVLALLPHALHPQVAERAAGAAALPHVPPGVEVPRVTPGRGGRAAPLRPPVSFPAGGGGQCRGAGLRGRKAAPAARGGRCRGRPEPHPAPAAGGQRFPAGSAAPGGRAPARRGRARRAPRPAIKAAAAAAPSAAVPPAPCALPAGWGWRCSSCAAPPSPGTGRRPGPATTRWAEPRGCSPASAARPSPAGPTPPSPAPGRCCPARPRRPRGSTPRRRA